MSGSPPESPHYYRRTLDCVHCGLCIQRCPTYRLDRLEQDSPRGRIRLARALAEGRTGPTADLFGPFDRCLDCRACEAVCPSGVGYHHVLEGARERIVETLPLPWGTRLKLLVLDLVLTRPRILRWSFDLLGLWQALGLRPLTRRLLPRALGRMEALLPPIPRRPDRRPPPPLSPAPGPRRHRVALFTGCVMTELFGRVHRDTVEVLQAHGCEVVTPRRQRCCGALSLHAGARRRAEQLALMNIRAFPGDVEAILFDSAGCGAMLREYGELLADTPHADEAATFAGRCREISEFLVSIGLRQPTGPVPLKVVYDDACHLCNAQDVRSQPRDLLAAIPGLETVESADPERCCGAAGIYNLIQPEIADRLLRWKVEELLATGADAVATANPGCLLQLRTGLGDRMGVIHPVELYARSLREGSVDGKA